MGKKISKEQVLKKIKEKLFNKNLEFVCFDGEYVNTRKTKAKVRCLKCGYISIIVVDSILNKEVKCKKCNKRVAAYSESDFINKCNKMGYEFIGFNDEYKNSKSKFSYKCNKCGKTVTVNCGNFMKNSYRGCCSRLVILSEQEYLNKINEIANENNYEILKIYNNRKKIGTKTRIAYKCIKCGNITETDIGHIINDGNRCPGCRGGSKVNNLVILKRISNRCKELNCTFVRFLNNSNKYENNLTRVLNKCNICGYEWDTSYAHFIRDTGCPNCGGTRPLTKEEALVRAIEFGKTNGITVVGFVNDEFKNNESRLELICDKCGHKWTMKYQNLMSNKGCPKCRISKLEDEISNLLKNNNIYFEYQKYFSWLKYKKPLSLDFYLPEYNIAIECQGIQHFKDFVNLRSSWFDGINHTKEEFMNLLKENIRRDLIKKRLCEKHEIKIFYYSNLGIEYPYHVYENFEEMIKDIKDYAYFKEIKKLRLNF